MELHLPPWLARALAEARVGWRVARGTERLFARDASLWTESGEDRWLGWLDAPETGLAWREVWQELAQEADARKIEDVLLLGMGGSSLGAEVAFRILGPPPSGRRLWVLDTTSPDQIRAVEASVDFKRSLVVVASKSGSTLEPTLLLRHLSSRARQVVGADWPRLFLAITDPGSALEAEALGAGFWKVVSGEPTIGGRFSVLSPFGLAIVALLGYELEPWLEDALRFAVAARGPRVEANPGVELGLLLAVAAEIGRDKLTFEFPQLWRPLVAWLEQLIAESLGKGGKLVLPVEGEPRLEAGAYGNDRLFVMVSGDQEARSRIAQLSAAGHPVVALDLTGPEQLFREYYRWEVATAVAGAWLALNPFDQPDVEAAKVEARRLTDAIEATGASPFDPPSWSEGPWLAWGDQELRDQFPASGSLRALLKAHLGRRQAGDYLALLAYLPAKDRVVTGLEAIRDRLARSTGLPVTLGFGPRYLHSTGQAHKGGANRGVFLLLTANPEADVPVPGRKFSFGQVLESQARGDFAVLAGRARRILRLHALGGDHQAALESLEAQIESL